MASEKIVVSGVAGVFPNLKNVAQLYTNLSNKIQSLNEIDSYWQIITPGVPSVIGKLPFEEKFDAGYFGVHYKQAEEMHHMCRMLLEQAVQAVYDSGINPDDLKGSKTGVFVANSGIEADNEWIWRKLSSPNFSMSGSACWAPAEWISYYLQLQGPSVTCDSACASSMYALDQAIMAIKAGKCDNALVCGVNIFQNPFIQFGLHQLGILEPNGVINVFDNSCNGYIRSEAITAVFVQKLQDAKRIYAEILNIKTNSDGFKEMGISHPSAEMIINLIEKVYDEVGVNPTTVSFLECHITGTAAGMSEEIKAVEKVFCSGRKTPLLVGSVKANVGHGEGASGLMSLIKILIGLQHNCVLPNPNYQQLTRKPDALQNGKIVVLNKHLTLPTDQDVIIGCNNFGFGGTNSHVIVKHFNSSHYTNRSSNFERLVCFSGRTMSSLTKIVNSLADNQTDEFLALLQNIFKRNVQKHWYRGYTIINNKNLLENFFGFCNEKPRLCLIYRPCTREWLKMSETLKKISLLSNSFKRVRHTLLSKEVDVFQLWKQNTIGFEDLVIATTALQIIITDLIKYLFQERITVVQGFSSGLIASAYAEGTLSLENALLWTLELKNRLKTVTNIEVIIILSILIYKIKVLALLEEGTKELTTGTIKLVIGSDKTNGQLNFNSNTTMLHVLGRLYVLGFDLNLDKLYPSCTWPVKAPLISPLIKWQHDDNWHVLKFEMRNLGSDTVTINLDHNKWKFLKGHVVDGRTLFPGSGYLFIVWNCYLKTNRLLLDETKVLFEDIKFYRLMVLSKQKPLTLTVNLLKMQNKFEVNNGNDCIVTGKIRALTNDFEFTSFTPKPKPQKTMSTKEFYKKLTLHGYNYKDEFCCVQNASLDGTMGSLKWYNWITFLDNVLHFTLLNKQQNYLYIPVEMERLAIDPAKHAQALYQYDNILPIQYEPLCKRITVPGVELRNPILSTIKIHSEKDPYLGIYKFLPFETDLSLEDSVKVNIQLVAENSLNNLKIIEVVDDFSFYTNEILYPTIDNVLQNEYVISYNLCIYPTIKSDYPNMIVQYKTIEQLPFDLNLVIISRGSQRQKTVAHILQNRNCFILSRESLNYETFRDVEVVSIHRTNLENLVLLRKSCKIPQKVIEVKSDFVWLEHLKSTLLQNEKVLLVAQNNPTSGILGLVNCLKQEVDQNVSCVYLSDNVKKFDLEDDFYQKQLRKGLLINVFKDGQWGSYKHLPLYQQQKDCEHVIAVTSGDLSHVEYVQSHFTKESLMMDKSIINVSMFVINIITKNKFLDLLGKRMMGISLNQAFSNYVSASTSITCEIPDQWAMEDAATVPATYLMVLYALLKVARLKNRQSILIHSGTDIVGQSAINIALYYNCNIFTTVESEENRHYLKTLYPSISDCHIENSHDTKFEQMILKQTKGKGVDIILNLLTEEQLHASLRCLSPNGVIVLSGKHDNKFGIDKLSNGRTFVNVSVDLLFNQHLSKKQQVLSLLQQGIKEGYVKPLLKVVYYKGKLQEGLGYSTLSKHVKKTVIKFKDETMITNQLSMKAKPRYLYIIVMNFLKLKCNRFFCDPNKVYVLIGGLGGIGLELAGWLISRNATKLIFVSRNGITTGYQSYKLNCWKKIGCKVIIAQDDLTTTEGCTKLLTETNKLGVVDGIFNLSVVLHDALIENQNENTFKTALAPKVLITRNMDQISKILCPRLRYFVLFSSFVCGRGNSGQSNYGMANSVAERICEQRKTDGYPALAIQWGFIGDVGLVAESLSPVETFIGLRKQKIASCLSVLDSLLTQDETIVSSTVFDSKEIKHNANPDNVLNLKHVSMHLNLSSLGMNSISIVELAQYLRNKCNLHFSLRELRNMTLHMLSEYSNTEK
ncbi:hypothetical protein RN001_010685 [Aquatica leii]|uniref:Ketosynthase family 3 (KS3) domain-containing protein n=1 Tax=Aquatica leii TaxID=1421715 RepID=A0AAN7PV47_9COLE|nr:hypothetical protein RN001_010685 [Aquatica leii]